MPLSEDEREQIIGLREAGHKIREIASMLGANKKTIDLWLRRYKEEGNVKQRLTKPACGAKKRRVTENKRNAIINLREKGFNVTAIARNLTISRRTVRRYIGDVSVEWRAAGAASGPCDTAEPRCGQNCKDASAEEAGVGCDECDPDLLETRPAAEPPPAKKPKARRKPSHSKKPAGATGDETHNKQAEYPFEVSLVSKNAPITKKQMPTRTRRQSSTRKRKKPVSEPCEIVCVPDIATIIKGPVATNANHTKFPSNLTTVNNGLTHNNPEVKIEPVEDVDVNIPTVVKSPVDSTTIDAELTPDTIFIKQEPSCDNLENIIVIKIEPVNDTEKHVTITKDATKGSGDTASPATQIIIKVEPMDHVDACSENFSDCTEVVVVKNEQADG